jgi:hypothetical protein
VAGQAALVAAAGAEHVLLKPGEVDRHHHDFYESPFSRG